MKKVKRYIYFHLSLIRDKSWLPEFIINIIDWLRYELFYNYDY